MPGTTPNLALRYPVASDAPDGAGAFYNLASDIEDRFGRAASAASSLANGTRYGQRAIVGNVEYRWNLTAWKAWESDWTDYTATWTNVTISTTMAMKWRYCSGEIKIRFNVGVAGAPSGRISFTTPVQIVSLASSDVDGTVSFLHAGDNTYAGRALTNGTNSVYLDTTTVATNNGNQVQAERGVTAQIPFSWNANDGIEGRLTLTPA